jgi:hypothetical protein
MTTSYFWIAFVWRVIPRGASPSNRGIVDVSIGAVWKDTLVEAQIVLHRDLRYQRGPIRVGKEGFCSMFLVSSLNENLYNLYLKRAVLYLGSRWALSIEPHILS